MAQPAPVSLPPSQPTNLHGSQHADDPSKPTYAFDGRGTIYMPRSTGVPGGNYHANYSRRRRGARRPTDPVNSTVLGGFRSWGGNAVAGGSMLPGMDAQVPTFGPGGTAVAALAAYGGQQTNQGILVPDPVAPPNANVDKLIELFKESGEYDRLRKEVFARFQKSEMRTVLLSRIDGVANECLEKDSGFLQRSAETTTEELLKEIDTYPFVERQVLCVPIWREDEWIASIEHSIFNLLHDRPVHAPPPVEPSIPPPMVPEPPKGPPPASRPWRHILPDKPSSSSPTPNPIADTADSKSPMPPSQSSAASPLPLAPAPVPAPVPSMASPMPASLPPLRMVPGMPPLPFPPPFPGMPGMPGMPMSLPPAAALLPGARPPTGIPPPWQLAPGLPPPPPGMFPPPTAFVGFPNTALPPPPIPVPPPVLTPAHGTLNGVTYSNMGVTPHPDEDLSEDDMAIDDD